MGVRLSPNAQILGAPPYEENVATYLYLVRELGRRRLGYVHFSDTGVRSGTPAVTESLLRQTRDVFPGAIVLAGGLDESRAENLVEEGLIDLAAVGQPFIANPDLVARLQHGWPLAAPDRNTYYGGDAKDYTDYPSFDQAASNPPVRAVP